MNETKEMCIRDRFQMMIADCEDGNIDLILTKSITRFARNTVECIQMCIRDRYRCAKDGAQFFIVTHSPILLGIPDADIYCFDNGSIHLCEYEETESLSLIHI